MRLFLGIEIPENIKSAISSYLEPLKKSPEGWEVSHDYHLTLLFIGEIDAVKLMEIKTKIEIVKFEPFIINIGELRFFNRRVAYMQVEPNPQLLSLRQKIHELFPAWVKSDEKPFVPHITVKRWQRYEYDEMLKGIEGKSFSESFEVRVVSIFESKKDSRGFKYHTIN